MSNVVLETNAKRSFCYETSNYYDFFVVVLLIVSMKIVVLLSVNSCISDTKSRKYSNVVLMHVHRGKSTT